MFREQQDLLHKSSHRGLIGFRTPNNEISFESAILNFYVRFFNGSFDDCKSAAEKKVVKTKNKKKK